MPLNCRIISFVVWVLVVAGLGWSADRNALSTAINGPTGLALDGQGHLYVIESQTERVLRINLHDGSITRVAGNGADCCWKDGIQATEAALKFPRFLAVDSAGDLYIGEVGGHVRKVTVATGTTSTVAGAGPPTGNFLLGARHSWRDNGLPALLAHFWSIDGLAFDAKDNMYIVDHTQRMIFKVDHRTGIVTTVAGNGQHGYGGDGGPAIEASFRFPEGLAFDIVGNLLIADSGNCRIRQVDSSSYIITTVAISGPVKKNGECFYYDNQHPDPSPSCMVVDRAHNIYFVEGAFGTIQRVEAWTDKISTWVGSGEQGFSGDNGPAAKARLNNPSGLAVDADGNLYIAEFVNNRIRRVDAKTRIITTIAGNGLPIRADVWM